MGRDKGKDGDRRSTRSRSTNAGPVADRNEETPSRVPVVYLRIHASVPVERLRRAAEGWVAAGYLSADDLSKVGPRATIALQAHPGLMDWLRRNSYYGVTTKVAA